jgi:signal transduction histidine kinase/DNA-binding NarL/FixJ family response regulator
MMKIKKAFIYLFAGMIISIVIIALFIAQLFYNRNKLTESYEIRHKSYKIAEELRQTSEDLTLYARLYVMTRDTLWETKYWNVLKIRNGEMPRPDGRVIALIDSMRALGFIQSEFELLKNAEFFSNQLVATEKKAFDIMDGKFSDSTASFSAISKSDKNYAQIIMFDNNYLEAKDKIMTPIQEFKTDVDKRTQEIVNRYNSRDRRIILSTLSLTILVIVLSFISYALIKKRSAEYVKAEQANRIKSEFLANMSHEIRTPMNAVLGYAELLATTGVDETQKGYIESIKSGGRALLTLINDVLDLSKIEAGRIELEFAYINTKAFFSEFEKIFFLKVSEKGLKFVLEISSGTPEGIYVDEARLRQIILNLAGNAIKFTNAGFVKLKVFTQNPKQSVSKDNITDEYVDLIVEVEDTGIGISEDFQEEIFDPFTQEGGHKKYGGTGLGLAITRKLLSLMNGTITFKSELGKGTTFKVDIPDVAVVRGLEKIQTEIQFYPREIIFDKTNIIIADDYESNRKYIVDALKETKISVLEADDGESAYSLARELIPGLIIADINMPGMNGFELLDKLKQDEKLKHIPVIAYSASVMKDQKEKVRNSEFAGLLIKPVQITELFLELMKHLIYKSVIAGEPELKGGEIDRAAGIMDLTQLIHSLETNYTEIWKTFSERQPINDIEEFGKNLVALGNNHNALLISEYGNEMVSAASSFNIKAVLKLLKKFPEIIKELNCRAQKINI